MDKEACPELGGYGEQPGGEVFCGVRDHFVLSTELKVQYRQYSTVQYRTVHYRVLYLYSTVHYTVHYTGLPSAPEGRP